MIRKGNLAVFEVAISPKPERPRPTNLVQVTTCHILYNFTGLKINHNDRIIIIIIIIINTECTIVDNIKKKSALQQTAYC